MENNQGKHFHLTDIFTFSNNITNEIYLHVIKFSMALKTHV